LEVSRFSGSEILMLSFCLGGGQPFASGVEGREEVIWSEWRPVIPSNTVEVVVGKASYPRDFLGSGWPESV
jgi:hypothetical protein